MEVLTSLPVSFWIGVSVALLVVLIIGIVKRLAKLIIGAAVLVALALGGARGSYVAQYVNIDKGIEVIEGITQQADSVDERDIENN